MPNYTRYNVFVVREDPKDKENAFWTKVGAMFPHQNGDGFNIQLDALPHDGKLVILPPKDDDKPQNQQNDNRRGNRR